MGKRKHCPHCDAWVEATWCHATLTRLELRHRWNRTCTGQVQRMDPHTWRPISND